VTELGGSIDELQVDLFKSRSLGVGKQALSESKDSLLRSDAASLDHHEVVVHFSVVRESSHGSDVLLGQIVLRCGIVKDGFTVLDVNSLTDSVDLLVHLSSVVVSLLTSTGHGELDTRRMPSSDTSDLP